VLTTKGTDRLGIKGETRRGCTVLMLAPAELNAGRV